MQVNNVSNAIPKKLTKGSGSNKNINNNQTPAFKGGFDAISLATANLIENGGLAVSFTLQDMLGTNLPRPIMGLKRNSKENKGEANKSFAFKELVREMLTGPSMFIIPLLTLKAGKKLSGETVNVPMKFIKSFGDVQKATGAVEKEDFIKATLSEIIKNAKGEAEVSAETTEKALEYMKELSGFQKKNKLFTSLNPQDAINNIKANKSIKTANNEIWSKLSSDFSDLAKQYADDVVNTDYTLAKVSDKAVAPLKSMLEHMQSYADDVIDKVKGQDIDKFVNKKVLTRAGYNVAMYAAIHAFLRIIPRLYNAAEGKGNSGLKGLMTEETLNDKTLEQKTETENKSKPSFGANPAAVVSTLMGENKSTFGKIAHKLGQWFEFDSCNVSFPLLLGIMGFGILIPRTAQAKDKYDREEILRRDLVTCATMCFGAHMLEKGFSKFNEKTSGFILTDKGQGFKDKSKAQKVFDYLRPIKGVQILSTNQINSKYSNIDKYKGGISGFCEYIDQNGGFLSSIFSIDEKAKNIVQGLLGNTNIDQADNATIKEAINKAKDAAPEKIKELTDLFHAPRMEKVAKRSIIDKMLGKPEKLVDELVENPWVKRARTLNARFTFLSTAVIVPLFLGFMLPAINERATKKRINKENAMKSLENQRNNLVSSISYLTKNTQPEVFKNFNSK